MEQTFWFTKETLFMATAIPRLLDKQIFVTAGITNDGHAMYRWTELGKTLADNIEKLVPMADFTPIEETAAAESKGPEDDQA
jgi:hypothetical protein